MEHAGIGEARVLLAIENVVGTGGDVAAVLLRNADRAFHDSRDVEVLLVHVRVDVDGLHRALGDLLALEDGQRRSDGNRSFSSRLIVASTRVALGDAVRAGPEIVDQIAEHLLELLARLDVERVAEQLEQLRARRQPRERHVAAAVEAEDVADRVAVRMRQRRGDEVAPSDPAVGRRFDAPVQIRDRDARGALEADAALAGEGHACAARASGCAASPAPARAAARLRRRSGPSRRRAGWSSRRRASRAAPAPRASPSRCWRRAGCLSVSGRKVSSESTMRASSAASFRT